MENAFTILPVPAIVCDLVVKKTSEFNRYVSITHYSNTLQSSFARNDDGERVPISVIINEYFAVIALWMPGRITFEIHFFSLYIIYKHKRSYAL